MHQNFHTKHFALIAWRFSGKVTFTTTANQVYISVHARLANDHNLVVTAFIARNAVTSLTFSLALMHARCWRTPKILQVKDQMTSNFYTFDFSNGIKSYAYPVNFNAADRPVLSQPVCVMLCSCETHTEVFF